MLKESRQALLIMADRYAAAAQEIEGASCLQTHCRHGTFEAIGGFKLSY